LNINNFLQIPGTTYIGDDRYDDVKYAMGDFWDNQVRSPYYLAKAFDDVSADIDHTGKELVWVSKNTKNNTAGLSYDTRNIISTGVTFNSPVLERNKASYANPTNSTTESVYEADYNIATISSSYGTFYNALSSSNLSI
jgi:hypothetical protein